MPIPHNSAARLLYPQHTQSPTPMPQPDINRYDARHRAHPDQIRPFYSSYRQSQTSVSQPRKVAVPLLANAMGTSLLTRLALEYWSPENSSDMVVPSPSESLFHRLYALMDQFSHAEELVTLVSNFEYFSINYSANVGLEILDLCQRSANAVNGFDFEILEEFFPLVCSGAFTSENLQDMVQLAGIYGVRSDHFQSEVRSFYQARNHMGWLKETDDHFQEAFEKLLTASNVDFKSKAALTAAFEKRFEASRNQHDVWRMTQAVLQGIASHQIDSDNSFYFAKRLKDSGYTLDTLQDDLNFFGMLSTQNGSAPVQLAKSYYAFTNSKFQMMSRHLRGQGKFSFLVSHLPERSRQAWFVLEAAFGDVESLKLARLMFGNQSFNHRMLDENEKRDLAIELFNAVADYIQLNHFESLDAFRTDPLIQRWFDPQDESVQTYRDKTFRSNSLVREKRNSSGIALMALGFLKEFRGQVWASAHLNQFTPFPDELTDPRLRHVFSGRNKIDPDGLYSRYNEEFDDHDPVIFEVKSFNEGDPAQAFSELKQFSPIRRSEAHGTLRYQFGRMAYHLLKNPDLHLHYHLITDVQSVTKEGCPISDEDRSTSFKSLLQHYLERELKLSKDKTYDVMDRVIVTFEPYLKLR